MSISNQSSSNNQAGTFQSISFKGGNLQYRSMASVKQQAIQWLWPDRVPLGKLTLLSGDANLGKSLITCDMAARVSAGLPWPNTSTPTKKGSVIMLSDEDDANDTIAPRLQAAGANLSKVKEIGLESHITNNGSTTSRPFDLSKDLDGLEELIKDLGDCRLVVFDPITSYMGNKNANKNADVRAVLCPLAAMAAQHMVAVVMITHLRKGDGNAVQKTLGSVAFGAVARAGWIVCEDKNSRDRRFFLSQKLNIGKGTAGLSYEIKASNYMKQPIIEWSPTPVNITANQALAPVSQRPGPPSVARDKAEGFLKQELSTGPKGAKEIKETAAQLGISEGSLTRASKAMGVKKEKNRFQGQSQWSLGKEDKGDAPGLLA